MLLLHAYRKTAIHRCISTQQCIRPLSTASQMAPVEIATSRAPTPRRIVPSRRGRRLSSRRVPMEATLDAVVVDRAGSSTSTMNALADDIPSEMRRLMQAGADMRQWCRPMASLSSSAGPSSSVLLDLSTSGSSSIGSVLGHGNGNSGNGSNSGPPGSTNLHTLRCSILTATGDIHTAARDIAKTELCARFALMQRDLRKLDSRFRHQLPAILVRPRAVLVNLGAIKVG